jgi:hypothetical protein
MNSALLLLTGAALGVFGLLGVAYVVGSRETAAPTPPPMPPRFEPGWYFVDAGEVCCYGLACEIVVGGEPWLRVQHPDPDDGFIGATLIPLREVTAMTSATEEECRECAAKEAAESATDLPPIQRAAPGSDKAN